MGTATYQDRSMKTVFDAIEAEFPGRLRFHEPLALYTTFKIGGEADGFIEVRTTQELVRVVTLAREREVPVTILGGGSNVLISDAGVRGLVVKNAARDIRIMGMKGLVVSGTSSGEVFVKADAGTSVNQLVRFTIEEGLAGLEMHLGLPGSVGGAIYMNSKWTKPSAYVGDRVYQATILTPDNRVHVVPKTYFSFQYDYSKIQKTGDIVLDVLFCLSKSDKQILWKTANASIAYRRSTQPTGVRSPGCTFKNISQLQALTAPTPLHTTSAGYLIDHAGLKGMAVGGARVSTVHANFIENTGKATAKDVIQLIDLIKRTVKEKYGIELEEEIVRIGAFNS